VNESGGPERKGERTEQIHSGPKGMGSPGTGRPPPLWWIWAFPRATSLVGLPFSLCSSSAAGEEARGGGLLELSLSLVDMK